MDNDEVTSPAARRSSHEQVVDEGQDKKDEVPSEAISDSNKEQKESNSTSDNSAVASAGAGGSASSSTASTPTLSARKSKIDIVLKPVGDAPILKQKRWSVDPDKEVGTIIQFIKKYLNLQAEHSLFVFVNQAFAPSPDQLIRNLYDCFGSDGKLILHYSKTVAWG